MKNKICPNDGQSIPWNGLGWHCEICGYTIEPTVEEVAEAVREIGNNYG